MTLMVRPGILKDAPDAIALLRRSITELCVTDHENDATVIASWLANKTETQWADWVVREDAELFVAERLGRIAGVAMVDHTGEILLNYVCPDTRFCGVSKALLRACEDILRDHPLAKARLDSTATARRFYERCGYLPVEDHSLRMEKPL